VNDKDGSIRWQQEFVARGRTNCHPTSAIAAPTPVSDGKYVYAFYSSNDLACVDLDGNLVWYRSLSTDFPKAGNDVGMSSSPIVVDGVCIVQVECQGDSFAAGLSCQDGRILWRTDRPKQSNWASPVAIKLPSGEQVVVMQSSQDLLAVSPKTGKTVWTMDVKCSSIPSAMAAESRLFVPAAGLTVFDLSSRSEQTLGQQQVSCKRLLTSRGW
jgi:outer membrane protein assembly factor BamB